MNTPDVKTIAALNDKTRETCLFQTANTRTVFMGALGNTEVEIPHLMRILSKVATFNDFTEDNDPYGEHDFGRFEFEGEEYFWKISYYDHSLQFGSPDPSDTNKTVRVLTIAYMEDY